MSDTLVSINRKITGAMKLESVVKTMKILAASNIGQYEAAVRSLVDYYRNVKLGLYVCLHDEANAMSGGEKNKPDTAPIGAVVFGSDQGLVGQFNDVLTDYVVKTLNAFHCKKYVWAVGERIRARLEDAGVPLAGVYEVPSSINAITPLGTRILIESEEYRNNNNGQFYIFHNRPKAGAIYEPVSQRLLPLDEKWLREITEMIWPTKNLPESMHGKGETLLALVREYLFVLLFRACAESLMCSVQKKILKSC
jgi:F-type H+-transporting ATPase subunit gamma